MSADRWAQARHVADAVLYEGYVLYPYRPSSRKNHVRFQFGVVVPAEHAGAVGSDEASVHTECVVEGDDPEVHLLLRCLQLQSRAVEAAAADGGFAAVPELKVGERLWLSWDEAVEHEVDLGSVRLGELEAEGPRTLPVALTEAAGVEVLETAAGDVAGRLVRTRRALSATVTLAAERPEGPYPLHRLVVTVENTTPWADPGAPWDEVTRRSLVSAHTLLGVDGGRFHSLLDPPAFARGVVGRCTNRRTFPVLVDDAGLVLLSSPIILYDQPQIAEESGGDFFDATEIDEILSLRVMTLTDEEKAEARALDPRAAGVIDRCDDMTPAELARLHGTVRRLAPVGDVLGTPDIPWWDPGADAAVDPSRDTTLVAGVEVGRGTRVVLRPSGSADAQDIFLVGRQATVEGVFHDVDGDTHLAVTLDDDPAAELHQWHGRFFYFKPDEVEVLR